MNKRLDWLDRAKEILAYAPEASDFIERASKNFSAKKSDAILISLLWVEANAMDELFYSLLGDINEELLNGVGTIDTTRGASLKQSKSGNVVPSYECSWTLEWESEKSVSIVLSICPTTKTIDMSVAGGKSEFKQDVLSPTDHNSIEKTLANAVVFEILDVEQ